MNNLARLHSEVEKHLISFPYFASLTIAGKRKFRNRVVQFLNHKVFYGKEGLIVTTEMQVHVAACAVQLTFGQSNFLLRKFKRIWLYPQSFYYGLTNQWMKGFTSKTGIIALSWEDFRKGYEDESDNYNLGLHELAHALHESVISGLTDNTFAFYFSKWETRTRRDFESLRSGSINFLRKYGGTNEHEFFAVCVEHFFESPMELRDKLPDIYYHLSAFLHQDPLNTGDDYRLRLDEFKRYNQTARNPISLSKVEKTYRYRDWHWTLTATMIGIFAGTIVLVLLSEKTLVPASSLLYAVLGFSALGILQIPGLRNSDAMPAKPLFLLYSLFGIGVNAIAVLLFINQFFIRHESIHTHKVMSYSRHDEMYVYSLENQAFIEYPETRSIDYRKRMKLAHPDSLAIRTGIGILGIEVHLGTIEIFK